MKEKRRSAVLYVLLAGLPVIMYLLTVLPFSMATEYSRRTFIYLSVWRLLGGGSCILAGLLLALMLRLFFSCGSRLPKKIICVVWVVILAVLTLQMHFLYLIPSLPSFVYITLFSEYTMIAVPGLLGVYGFLLINSFREQIDKS